MSKLSDALLALAAAFPPESSLREGTLEYAAQAKELERDAERYRYVRANPAMLLHLSNRDFDAAIDKERGQ